MRIIGVFYLLQFVMMVFVRAPIRAMGFEDALARAAAGEALPRFLIDTWVTFGLEVGAIGAALLFAARAPERARGLVWAIVAIEIGRGIVADIYMLARGQRVVVAVVWMVLHTVVIVTALLCLRGARPHARVAAAAAA
jgi:hypothetical protein